jgi:alpha,alpha-trehalose phosphorylase (configuration-retaining)
MTYSREHHAKFVGAGITETLANMCPDICAFLWRELDIVVMKFDVQMTAPKYSFSGDSGEHAMRDVDEQADSAVRKCIMYFGPNHNPALSIGFRNRVEPDAGGRIELVHDLKEYEKTVHPRTWKCVMKFANELKEKNTKVAFFSATPQGGGVALMRHALIRFFRLLGVNFNWYFTSSTIILDFGLIPSILGTSQNLIQRCSVSPRPITTFSRALRTPKLD